MSDYVIILHGAKDASTQGHALLKQNFVQNLNLSQDYVDEIFETLPVVLKENASREIAQHYVSLLDSLGAIAEALSVDSGELISGARPGEQSTLNVDTELLSRAPEFFVEQAEIEQAENENLPLELGQTFPTPDTPPANTTQLTPELPNDPDIIELSSLLDQLLDTPEEKTTTESNSTSEPLELAPLAESALTTEPPPTRPTATSLLSDQELNSLLEQLSGDTETKEKTIDAPTPNPDEGLSLLDSLLSEDTPPDSSSKPQLSALTALDLLDSSEESSTAEPETPQLGLDLSSFAQASGTTDSQANKQQTQSTATNSEIATPLTVSPEPENSLDLDLSLGDDSCLESLLATAPSSAGDSAPLPEAAPAKIDSLDSLDLGEMLENNYAQQHEENESSQTKKDKEKTKEDKTEQQRVIPVFKKKGAATNTEEAKAPSEPKEEELKKKEEKASQEKTKEEEKEKEPAEANTTTNGNGANFSSGEVRTARDRSRQLQEERLKKQKLLRITIGLGIFCVMLIAAFPALLVGSRQPVVNLTSEQLQELINAQRVGTNKKKRKLKLTPTQPSYEGIWLTKVETPEMKFDLQISIEDAGIAALRLVMDTTPPPIPTNEEIVAGVDRPWLRKAEIDAVSSTQKTSQVENGQASTKIFAEGPARVYVSDRQGSSRFVAFYRLELSSRDPLAEQTKAPEVAPAQNETELLLNIIPEIEGEESEAKEENAKEKAKKKKKKEEDEPKATKLGKLYGALMIRNQTDKEFPHEEGVVIARDSDNSFSFKVYRRVELEMFTGTKKGTKKEAASAKAPK